MNQQKNQGSASKSLLEGIQGEVSAENAPLLEFLTRYAWLIAGAVLLLLFILGGLGIWNWLHNSKLEEARAELALVSNQYQGQAKLKALRQLAEDAPVGVQLEAWLKLAQSAQENGDIQLAGEAWTRAAELDRGGAIGITAALGTASVFLQQGNYQKALEILQELEQRTPDLANVQEFQRMLAETAARAGKLELARNIYQKLANEFQTEESAYYQKRADALTEKLAAGKAAGEK